MSAIKRSNESEDIPSTKRIKIESEVNPQSEGKPNLINRESFERMDDQLIQQIFYYLPLEDKINFLKLNKRMKICLSESQLDLTIDHKIGNKFNSWPKLELKETNREGVEGVVDEEEDIEEEEDLDDEELDYFLNAKKSELIFLLKNFKCIECLDLCNSSLDVPTVSIICDNNCPKLKILKFTDFGISDKSIVNLGQTYGHKLTKLVVQSSFCGNKLGFDKLFLNYCQNLVEIHCESIETFVQQNDNFLPKLRNITTFIRKSHDFNSLSHVINRYSHQLKNLSLFIHLEEGIDDNSKNLEPISNLVALESLNLDFFDWFYVSERIDKNVEKIAINCKEMKSFRIAFNFCCYELISLDLFNAFGLFSNLKKFCAQLFITDKEKKEISEQNGNQLIQELRSADISCWKGCKGLTHLDLCFSEMTDKFVENIDLFLPNLISIHLSSAKELTDCALNSFIKLKRLKTLKLSKNRFRREIFPEITDSGIEKLLTSNPSLRYLTFLGQPNITHKTIDLFIDLAEKNRNKSYLFECIYEDFDENCVQYLKNIDIKTLKKPQNLSVNIERFDASDEELFVSDESEGEVLSDISSDEEIERNSETNEL